MGLTDSSQRPVEVCLVPPSVKAGRRRRIAVDSESFPKVGLAASELLHLDFDERVRAQLFLNPEKNVEVFTNFGLGHDDSTVNGVASVRWDQGPVSVESEINTRTSGQLNVTGIVQVGENGAVFLRGARKLGIFNDDQGNEIEAGFRYNAPRAAVSVKGGVNVDEVQEKGALEKLNAEITVVSNLAERVAAQITTYGAADVRTGNLDVKDVACTLTYHSPSSVVGASPGYETAVKISELGKHINLSYFQHIVTRRKIYNPIEEHNVTQIVNYVDLGMEVDLNKDPITGKPITKLDAGAAWQLNKNLLLKGKVGSSGIHGALKFKTWGIPKLCGSVSAGVGWNGKIKYGLQLSVEDLALVPVYEKPSSELLVTTPYGVINAEKIERTSHRVPVGEQARNI